MNTNVRSTALAALLLLAGCAYTHTPPGTSVEVALAKKGELVKLPAPAATPAPVANPAVAGASIPAVEPPMPEKNAVVEKVAEAYSRGIFCLETGRNAEAITAFEEAVKLDPTFTDAWENLAVTYEKMGDSKKALEAFKKAKTLARK